jgi:hypothetical protein
MWEGKLAFCSDHLINRKITAPPMPKAFQIQDADGEQRATCIINVVENIWHHETSACLRVSRREVLHWG